MFRAMRSARNKKGFTLIELAIVLVIIGIIIAAIMKGRDIMRSAQTKAFWQGFAGKWITMSDNYFDKTGQNFTDGAVNGGNAGRPDGFMDGLRLVVDAAFTRNVARDALMKAGINPCDLIKTGLLTQNATCPQTGVEIAYGQVDSDVFGKVSNIGVGFTNNQIGTANNAIPTTRKNIVVFLSVPIDIAKAIDTFVDGLSAGNAGRVISFGCTNTAADALALYETIPAIGSTVTLSETPGTAAGADWPTTADDNRIKCVVAYLLEH
jgi:prepilin-type N-terminal cleavage/methylation domain-containing protein